jgi:hypothetical protein
MRVVRFVLVVSAALAVVSALTLAGCGSSPQPASTPSAASSGIIGRMTEAGGPIGGVRPMAHVQIEVRQGDVAGNVVATVESGADGRFTVDLPPGRYTVVPIARGDETVISATATVTPGQYAHVKVGFSVR